MHSLLPAHCAAADVLGGSRGAQLEPGVCWGSLELTLMASLTWRLLLWSKQQTCWVHRAAHTWSQVCGRCMLAAGICLAQSSYA